MLERVEFRRFRSLVNVDIGLAPMTVLVGKNGSGKSSVLLGIERMYALAHHNEYQSHTLGRAGQVFSNGYSVDRLAHSKGPSPHGFKIELLGSGFGKYSVEATVGTEKGAPRATFDLRRTGEPSEPDVELSPRAGTDAAFFRPMPELLGSCAWCRPNAPAVAEPSYSESADPHVLPDGTGVASVLQKLQLLRDGRFEAVEEGLRRVVPFVKRLRAAPAQVRRREHQVVSVDGQDFSSYPERDRTGARIEAEVEGAGWLGADQLSEGTLLTIAVLTAVHDVHPRTLLLDDIDHALHPSAQGAFVAELRRIQGDPVGIQIIATTHSPFVVDHLQVEEVRVMSLSAGASRCVPLASHPKWAKRSGFLNPGEFWSGVGEDWVGG